MFIENKFSLLYNNINKEDYMEYDLRYPVKYAILELKERMGWLDNYEERTCGFIVSKCYVVDSNVKYLSDGTIKISHKVVFPFKNNSYYELSLQHINEQSNPTRDISGDCYEADIVSDLFDSYDEANTIAYQKNKDLERMLVLKVYVSDPNFKEKYQKLKDDFNQKLDICKKIEDWILWHTTCMKISRKQIDLNFMKMQECGSAKLVKKKG